MKEITLASSIRSKIPLLFLVTISIWWGFYYQSKSELNDYGNANFEWLFLLDALIALPIVCFLCLKDKKEAALKSIVYICIAVFIGSYIIPEQSKLISHYLEDTRYFVLALILLFELVAMLTVYFAIKAALTGKQDPDVSIERPIKKHLGSGIVSTMLCFETRMWTFAFFSQKIQVKHYIGEQHFSYHKKDGAQTNLLGFICLIALEMPLMHLLLYFIWSPFAANVISFLTLFSLVFFIAEYKAISRRPISIANNKLIIRYGLYPSLIIPVSNVSSIRKNSKFIRRSSKVRRFNYAGSPNVAIELIEPIGKVERIYIGVDQASSLILSLKAARATLV